MNTCYQDLHVTLYNQNFLDNDLPDESIQCVVTSPPYWGLRKYSGEQDLLWGGDKDCQHEWELTPPRRTRKAGDIVNLENKEAAVGGNLGIELPSTNTCQICGAWRGAYGLEPTPEMYVEHTIEILREIRRVLRKDGVVFWNIGDSYNGSGGDHKPGGKNDAGFQGVLYRGVQSKNVKTLKPKDLCLIPFRVAIAAQTDGWWVRSVIIWNKPNPMPESVTDRPTESHEYILMLTKSAKYYWDQEAVREPLTLNEVGWKKRGARESYNVADRNDGGKPVGNRWPESGRNLRSVWTFSTQPFPEAHFAVFPEKLPELCIKAASKEGDSILDPFAGAGTTLFVSKKLNRKAIGCELSQEYCNLIVKRNRQQVIL